MHRVPSCEWKMPDTKTCLLSPCADWQKDDGEKNKASYPPPTHTHTLFCLVCYESITNPFIACSRRIALRDNALKGYRAVADAQLQCGSASLDKASTSWVHWHQRSGDSHGIRAVWLLLRWPPSGTAINTSGGLSSARLRQCPSNLREHPGKGK